MQLSNCVMNAEKKDRVWAPDPIEGYVLGYVTDVGGDSLTIETADNPAKTITAFYDDVYPALDEVINAHVEDNCSLVYLNEATLLQNVRLRYENDLIYSYVANILIAVNPYKPINDLYSVNTAHRYKGKSLGVLPPHVFAIADKVYRNMRTNRMCQSIIVSGESGAGKTETTKHILRYLMKSYGASSGLIEKRIVEANPLLESLGNSKTLRNNNSSRFGKFLEIHFNAQFQVVGGHISHYLLEKSRVCSQMNEERNYHIFYHMLAGAPNDMKQALGIDPHQNYVYLDSSSRLDHEMNDKEEYHNLIASMDCIGMTGQEKADLFRVAAAVLHLGNILFEDDTSDKKGGSLVSRKTERSLVGVANLLGVAVDDLRRCLTSRIMTTTKKGAIGTIINVPLKPEQAVNARDALSKAIYVRLFDWVIERVNKCFPFSASKYYIGVLDIAGFEYYQFNSFEQFCINYCNEKLQQLFNERVFKDELELYKIEGLGLPTTRYIDNQDCIDLIESKGSGIIDLLDEECRLPRGSSEHFTFLVHSSYKNHFRLLLPRQSKLSQQRSLRDEEAFIVRHFAGAVCYKTTGFLDKNNDSLHGSLEQLITTSVDPFVKGLFPRSSSDPTGSYAKKLVLDSVSCKFRTQLDDLMKRLRKTEACFIRCVKPNLQMLPGKFIGGQVLSQLQCGGTVTVLKLMEGGYPSRTQFIDLYNMYKSVLPAKLARLDPRTFCEALFRAVGVRENQFKFGNNKVFFKAGKFAEFDEVMHSNPDNLVAMVNKVQRWLVCKQWRKVIYGAIAVQKLTRKIQYRQENALIVQSTLRTCLAIKRHRPRFRGIKNLQQLKLTTQELGSLVSSLQTDRAKLVKRVSDLDTEIDEQIHTIKREVIQKDKIEKQYDDILNALENLTNEIQARQEQQKVEEEEREKMRKLIEIQEHEKMKREVEAVKLKQLHEEMEIDRMRKEEEERKRVAELQGIGRSKLNQEESDRLLGFKLMKEDMEQEMKLAAAAEQERRDFELALRLAQTESQSQTVISEQLKYKQKQHTASLQKQLQRSTNPVNRRVQAAIKQYDLTKWSYAQLRDSINTSCDVSFLNDCREELHRRLKVYHAWRSRNSKQTSGEEEARTHRIPQDVMSDVGGARTFTDSEQRDRYFRVPFLRPSSQDQLNKSRGWWYAHFKGQWIVRQLELHPHATPLLLVAGKDDMEMCELSLDETGLTCKKGAEITKDQFDIAWKKYEEKP